MVEKRAVVMFSKFNLLHSYLICYSLSKSLYSSINGPWLSLFWITKHPNHLHISPQISMKLSCVRAWNTFFLISETRKLTKSWPTKCRTCHFHTYFSSSWTVHLSVTFIFCFNKSHQLEFMGLSQQQLYAIRLSKRVTACAGVCC